MQFILKNQKRIIVTAFLIITSGFILRLYAATNVPLVPDEYEKIAYVNEIIISKEKVYLPMGSSITNNPPLLPYLMKLSSVFLGDTNVAFRFPSIFLGTLTLLIIFLLIKENIDDKTALLTLTLMSFSQFCIGSTRIAWEDGILIFFASCVLLFTQKAILSKKKHFLWLSALFMGLGLFVKGTIVTLFPVIVFYIFFYKENKNIFKKQHLMLFITIVFLINAPTFFWNLANNTPNYEAYSKEADFFKLSLVPTALFLGEIIIRSLSSLNDSVLQSITSYEYPFLDGLTGLLCVLGAVYILKKKKSKFINLLIWLFYFNFIFFSFVRPRSGGGYLFHLDNFWWATIAIIPGFIFAAILLLDLNHHYKKTKILTFLIILYSIFNSIHFVQFPANCFIPRRSIQLYELKRTAQDFKNIGAKNKAASISTYIRKNYKQ